MPGLRMQVTARSVVGSGRFLKVEEQAALGLFLAWVVVLSFFRADKILRSRFSRAHICRALFQRLLHRFSDVGDSVLASAGHRDTSLASAELHQGRVAIVLEPIASKLTDSCVSLAKLVDSAAKVWMWDRILKVSQPPVPVGPNKLPILVQVSNIPTSISVEVQGARSHNEDDDPERTVANRCAAQHRLLMRVCLLGLV